MLGLLFRAVFPRHAQCGPGLKHAGARVLRGLPRGDLPLHYPEMLSLAPVWSPLRYGVFSTAYIKQC